MLFMKGDPDGPRCGFSRTIVGLLKEKNVKFGTFDILSDNDVRQGMLYIRESHRVVFHTKQNASNYSTKFSSCH